MVANIKNLIKEIKSYEFKDKVKLLSLRIEERLNKSLKEYYKQLDHTLEKLSIYDDEHSNLTIIKNLNKKEV